MSADASTAPTLEEDNIFSGLKKKKKSKKVEFDSEAAEPAPAPTETGDAPEPSGDAPAEEDGENMFGDLKKK